MRSVVDCSPLDGEVVGSWSLSPGRR
uniref:Uncharacterized protein n=1 Tax=Anguilla anguilla TaxID=7936 RepID=A0A0E9UET5_ANGAN